MRSLVVVLALVRIAAADDSQAARTLFKRGVEEYKAKKYGEASITLLKSYELDPKPDTLFALAQAERLDNRCNDAVEHYKKLLEQTSDVATAKAVQSNLELCVQTKPVTPDKPVETKPSEPVKPQIVTKTVVRHERETDKLATTLFATGGFAIGASAMLFLAARDSSADSDRAATLDESNRLFDRSKRERTLSFVAAGAGVALVTGGVVRVLRHKPPQNEIAIAPLHGGAAIALSSHW